MKKQSIKIICFGEFMVDFTSLEPGKPLSRVINFQKHPGGAPANVAIGLHFHRIPAMLWSKVGKDSLGEFLIDQLRIRGLLTDGIRQDEKYPTKIALVKIDEQGERSFEFHNVNCASNHITGQDLDLNLLETARIFHFSGVALLSDTTYQTTLMALRHAERSHCLVSFDPNIRIDRMKNPAKILARIDQVLQSVDLLKMSARDWEQFFQSKSPSDILQHAVSLLILTEGAKGARFITARQEVFAPAPEVRVVDTTGAGDAFTAAFLSKLVKMPREMSLRELPGKQLLTWGKFANKWSAKIIQHYGATGAYFQG